MNSGSHRVITEHLISSLPDLKLIYLFGSQVNNTAASDSDIDIAVLCNEPAEPLMLWDCAQDLAVKFDHGITFPVTYLNFFIDNCRPFTDIYSLRN